MEKWLTSVVTSVTKRPPDDDVRRLISNVSWAVIGLLTFGATLLAVDIWGHWGAKNLGTFGDFFGGVFNPILAFFTVAGLALTVVMQRAGFSEARTRAFETTFFNMLDLHTKVVQDLHFNPAIIERNEDLARTVALAGLPEPKAPDPVSGRSVFSAVLSAINRYNDADKLRVYEWFQKNHNDILGHYFRNLYQILRLVKKFERELEDPAIYTAIVRAQLSTYELQLLFYNCLGEMVDSGAFRDLVKRYKLLEHLPLVYEPAQSPGRGAAPNSTGTSHRIRGENLPTDLACFEQYFEEEFHKGVLVNGRNVTYKPGAFGTNPQVKRYLAAIQD